MEIVRKLPQLLLMAVLSIAAAEANRNYSSQLKNCVTSLNALLDYMLVPRRVVGDLIFGVVLARGQLAVLRKHLLQSEDNRVRAQYLSTVLLLERKCDEIYNRDMPIRQNGTSQQYDNLVANIVQEYLWEVDYPLTLGKLRSPSEKDQICGVSCGKQHKLTWKQIMCILCSGSPHEGQSDHCIGLLFSPKLCGTSSTCWDIMTNKDEEVHGYALTHRLLYLEVARQLGCGNQVEFSSIETSIRNLCSDILGELYHIIDLGLPTGFRDLFLEQISLCGMEGFAEFLNPLYVDWILPLQAPEGCFGEKVKKRRLDGSTKPTSHSRRKRNDGDLTDGCTMHITGIAAVFLALNIRAIVELWDPTILIPSL